ncbi:unnamed protein product, partial [marine sediment metagenome]
DDTLLRVGGLDMLRGIEGGTDIIHLGDADWDYLVIGDTTTGVNLSTYNYSDGSWDIAGDMEINGGDKVIATSSPTWSAGDMIYYDGFNWVILSTEGVSAGAYLKIGTDGLPTFKSKSYACITKAKWADTVTVEDTYIVVIGTWGINLGSDFSVSGDTITYTGADTKKFGVVISITARSSVVNTVCHWKAAVNGVVNDNSIQGRKIAVAGDIASITLTCLGELNTNDEITIRISADKISTITHENLNITLIEAD